MNDDIKNEYFEWLFSIVCFGRYKKYRKYRKILMHLHNTDFIYSIGLDANRARDGEELRDKFIYEGRSSWRNRIDALDGPCSVLEVMVALSVRCELHIMDDPEIGNQTGKWFWGMIDNLGLSTMTDDNYDKGYTTSIIDRFLYREYSNNGRGGLFTVDHTGRDLRNVEIWYQMMWYLSAFEESQNA